MKTNKIQFSIIIPTYNRCDLLKNAINSILNQTYQDFEIIIIDDNSIDDTYKVYQSFNDKRISYFKNDINLGVSASRNQGILRAKYDYVAFLDDDDEWLENKLEIQMNLLNRYQYDFLFTQFTINNVNFPNVQHVNNDNLFESTIKNPILSPCTLVCKTQILKDLGMFNCNTKCFEDYELSLKLFKNYKGYFISKSFVRVNVQEKHLSSDDNAIEGLRTRVKLFKQYYKDIRNFCCEKSWLLGLLNFEWLCNKEDYNKEIDDIEIFLNRAIRTQRELIKLEDLDRKMQFLFFNKLDKPFWSVTTKINIHKLVKFCKKNKFSFYGCMCYILLQASINIKNFRLRYENNNIYEYQNLSCQITELTKNGIMDISRRIHLEPFDKFILNFNNIKNETFNCYIPPHPVELYDNVIFFSCLPWFEFSEFNSVLNNDSKDLIPRITWDKYHKINHKYYIDINFTVNHSFIDGSHINDLLKEIQKEIKILIKKSRKN